MDSIRYFFSFGSPLTTAINDPFSGRFSYLIGPGNPDLMPGDPKLGQYSLASFELDQAVFAITPASIIVRYAMHRFMSSSP